MGLFGSSRSVSRVSAKTTALRFSPPIEPLENRTLLSGAQVISVLADNRGEVIVTLSATLDPANVNKTSVQMYSPGPDGVLGTADDARVPASVRWTDVGNRITIEGEIAPDTPYRVKLVATRMRDDDGTPIDGDFLGSLPSGNHHAGGNFEFAANPDTGPTPTVRLSTTAGVISLALLRAQKPISTANFLSYANAGDYDGIFFTRSVPNFVLQTGALGIDDNDNVQVTPAAPPVANEFSTGNTISNTLGTVSFAKISPPAGQAPSDATINSATNQFFFNLADNGQDTGRPNNLDQQNGGFTVFAKVANASSLATMQNIAGDDTVALYDPVDGNGVLNNIANVTDLTDTPVVDRSQISVNLENLGTTAQPNYQYVATGSFDPQQDLITIRRTAVLMHVTSLD